jgi:zinc/manganese transport system permease protein
MFSSFMINSWIVATIVAATAGLVGYFVVLRGASFAAHALPLSAFPGAAAAALLGVNEIAGLVVFAGLGVLGIHGFSRQGRPEVATALTLVLLLGIGTLLLSLGHDYAQMVDALLFGQVLGVSRAAIWPIAGLSALAAGATLMLLRPLLLSAVSPELARARAIAPGRMDLMFLLILALAEIVALPVVGALLVFSLMVGPASAARNLTDRPWLGLVLSVGLALAIVWLALALSYQTNWPIGFFVGGFGALAYALGRAARSPAVWRLRIG